MGSAAGRGRGCPCASGALRRSARWRSATRAPSRDARTRRAAGRRSGRSQLIGIIVVKPDRRHRLVGSATRLPAAGAGRHDHQVRGYEFAPAESRSRLRPGPVRNPPQESGSSGSAKDCRRLPRGDVPYRAYFDHSMWLCTWRIPRSRLHRSRLVSPIDGYRDVGIAAVIPTSRVLGRATGGCAPRCRAGSLVRRGRPPDGGRPRRSPQ